MWKHLVKKAQLSFLFNILVKTSTKMLMAYTFHEEKEESALQNKFITENQNIDIIKYWWNFEATGTFTHH